MYITFELYNKQIEDIKQSDLFRLNGVLFDLDKKVGELIDNNQYDSHEFLIKNVMHIVYYSELEGMIKQKELPEDFSEIHPIRSLCKYGSSLLFGNLDLVSTQQKKVLEQNKLFFKSAYIIQQALQIEKAKGKFDEPYINNLENTLSEIKSKYKNQIEIQKNEIDKLKIWMNKPPSTSNVIVLN